MVDTGVLKKCLYLSPRGQNPLLILFSCPDLLQGQHRVSGKGLLGEPGKSLPHRHPIGCLLLDLVSACLHVCMSACLHVCMSVCQSTDMFVCWIVAWFNDLFGWLVGWLVGWLIQWFDWSVGRSVGRSVGWLVQWFGRLVGSMIRSVGLLVLLNAISPDQPAPNCPLPFHASCVIQCHRKNLQQTKLV